MSLLMVAEERSSCHHCAKRSTSTKTPTKYIQEISILLKWRRKTNCLIWMQN